MQTTRFHFVASLIGAVAIVALLALAYDASSKQSDDALLQVESCKTFFCEGWSLIKL